MSDGGWTSIAYDVIPDGLVDHFEEALYEDKSNTLSDYYVNGNNLSLFSRQTSTVYEGSYALRADQNSSSGRRDGVVSGNGISSSTLPNYPSAGDTFEVYFRGENIADSQLSIGFGCQNSNSYMFNGDFYSLRFELNENALDFKRLDSGSATELDSNGFSYTNGNWYRVEVDWGSSGSITATVFDASSGSQEAQVSANDTTYTSGGISLNRRERNNDGSIVYFDNYNIL